MDKPEVAIPQSSSNRWSWGVVAVLIVTSLVRWHRLELPLERDEGEYAYAGQLILRGEPPYAGAYNMKLPGIYLAYAAILGLFGETVRGVHLGLLLVNLASIVLVFRIGKRLMDDRGAFCGAAAFAVLSMHQAVTGLYANSEHFVVLPMLGGTLQLLKALDEDRWWRWWLVGVWLGTAFVVKQHGVMFMGFGGAVMVWTGLATRPMDWRGIVRRGIAYLGGAVTPFLAICIWLAAAGVFSRFWFWTFEYAPHYVAQLSFEIGAIRLSRQLLALGGELTGLWLLAGIGVVGIVRDRSTQPRSVVWLAWAVASFVAVCPGLYFRNHYFLLVLPVSALLAGLGVSRMMSRAGASNDRPIAPLVCFAVALVWAFGGQANTLILMSDEAVSRRVYRDNPFPEALVIGEYIRDHTQPEETVGVIGSEPEIYFYSQRRSATGHIYTYALMEEHPFARDMQREMIQQIEAARPRYLVYVNVKDSLYAGPKAYRDLLEWSPLYIKMHYQLVGLVRILPGGTEYEWDSAVQGKSVPGPDGSWLAVYRRH